MKLTLLLSAIFLMGSTIALGINLGDLKGFKGGNYNGGFVKNDKRTEEYTKWEVRLESWVKRLDSWNIRLDILVTENNSKFTELNNARAQLERDRVELQAAHDKYVLDLEAYRNAKDKLNLDEASLETSIIQLCRVDFNSFDYNFLFNCVQLTLPGIKN